MSSRADAGFHSSGQERFLAGAGESAGHPRLGRSARRSRVVVISPVQGQCRARRRARRRPVATSWPAAENSGTAGDVVPSDGPGWAGQGEHGHPGQQVESDLDDLQPNLVLRGVVQGLVPQAGRPGGSGAFARPGPSQGPRSGGWAGRRAVQGASVRGHGYKA